MMIWDLGIHRLRRYAQLRKLRREAMSAARSRLRLHKVGAQIRLGGPGDPETEALDAQVILGDIRGDGLRLYSSQPLGFGQEVSIVLEAPRPFFARARVTSCYLYAQSGRVLRERHFPHRVGVEFIFESELERAEVARFRRTLELVIP